MSAAQQLKRYYDPEDLSGEEWELNNEEIAALDLWKLKETCLT